MVAMGLMMAERGIQFDKRITLGNVLTIVSGIAFAVGLLIAGTLSYAELKGGFSQVVGRIDALECNLAKSGVLATTAPCMFRNASMADR